MHILLTDRLSCPRCGPEFGLILLARDVRERRVFHGDFGCPNCREQYPVVEAFADLRAPPRTPLPGGPGMGEEPSGPEAGEGDAETALRMAALMGVTEGPGTLLLVGPVALHAAAVARLVRGIEVVGIHDGLRTHPQEEGVSRMVSRPGVPFFSGTFLGVVISGELPEKWLSESVRVVSPLGRLVVWNPGPEVRAFMEGRGLEIVLEEGGVLVARRPGGARAPLITLRGP